MLENSLDRAKKKALTQQKKDKSMQIHKDFEYGKMILSLKNGQQPLRVRTAKPVP